MTTGNSVEFHTLLDWNQMRAPEGGELEVAKLMYQRNDFSMVMPYREANDGVGHKIGIQTSLPTANRTKIGKRQKASHGTQAVITEVTTEAFSRWKALYDLTKLDGAGVEILQQTGDHAEALAQLVESDMIYGQHDTDEEQPNGFMMRRNSLSGEIGKYTVDGGGSGDNGKSLQSILLCGLGSEGIFGVYPKGHMTAGLENLNLGLGVDQTADGELDVYRGRFTQHYGLAEKDHRFSVRIANINVNGFGDPASGNKSLKYLMLDAMARVRSRMRLKLQPNGVNHYWFMTNAMFRELMHELDTAVSQGAGIRYENVNNGFVELINVPVFGGIPIMFSEQMAVSETAVA